MKIDLEHFPTDMTAQRMLRRVSKMQGISFYENSYVGKWLYQVMGQEMGDARIRYEELREQAFPETATWGLFYWEQRYGLPTNSGQPIPLRRQAVLTRRSIRAPMNPARVELIVNKMTGLPVNVTENVAPYRFLVAILGGGVGVDYGAVSKQLRKIKPSHQNFEYAVTEELDFTLYDGILLIQRTKETFIDDEDMLTAIYMPTYAVLAMKEPVKEIFVDSEGLPDEIDMITYAVTALHEPLAEVFVDNEGMPIEITMPVYAVTALHEPLAEVFVDNEGMPTEITLPGYAVTAMLEPAAEIFVDDEGMEETVDMPQYSPTGISEPIKETFVDNEKLAEAIDMPHYSTTAIREPIEETFVDNETLPRQFNETSHTFTTPWESRTEVFE